MIIGVLVELSNKSIDKIFDYLVPDKFLSLIKEGIRVEVPFGHQTLEGFVLEIKDKSESKVLKEIISVKDIDIVLNDELLKLGKKMQENTLATLISCYQVMLPKALKAKQGRNINIKFDSYYRLNDVNLENYKFNESQQRIIDLCRQKSLVLRGELVDISLSSLNTLLKKGILKEEKKEHYRLGYVQEKTEKKS